MDARERVSRVLAGEFPDRIPLDDGYWETTVDRWHQEGLPAGVSPRDYFGTNEIVRINGDYTMQFPERVVAEAAAIREYWDSDGALRRDLHLADGWTSQWLDYTIQSPQDWQAHSQRMAFNPSRLPATALESYRQARAQGQFVCYMAHACFHPTWMRIGMVNMLTELLDRPDFISELFAAHAQLVIDIYEGMRRQGMSFDGALLADDLGYTAAPLIAPRLYREMVYPHHKRLCDHFANDGLKTILHSDGNVEPLVPHFLDAGFAALNPLEVKAGLDIRKLYAQYGDRLTFYGNIDVRKLAGSRAEIEEEITSKLAYARRYGRYIYFSDHSVPHSVSFENYAFAIELIRQHGRYE